MFPPDAPWKPTLAWGASAGRALRSLAAQLPTDREFQIIVFGSAPLQLGLDPTFLSGDVDVICKDPLADAIQQAGLAKGQGAFFIEQCEEHVFIAASAWRERAHSEWAGNVT